MGTSISRAHPGTGFSDHPCPKLMPDRVRGDPASLFPVISFPLGHTKANRDLVAILKEGRHPGTPQKGLTERPAPGQGVLQEVQGGM